MPITILDLAIHRGAKADSEGGYSLGSIQDAGLPFMGGCSVCGACIAAYNACPSKSGFLKCASGCIGEDGWEDVEQANKEVFDHRLPGDYEACGQCGFDHEYEPEEAHKWHDQEDDPYMG